ncbi:hypothetical protein M758_8G104000 [Ceratodon purpureus]|nr:hypothetical protein M758_8G104000 [Ceratodon purpureus]
MINHSKTAPNLLPSRSKRGIILSPCTVVWHASSGTELLSSVLFCFWTQPCRYARCSHFESYSKHIHTCSYRSSSVALAASKSKTAVIRSHGCTLNLWVSLTSVGLGLGFPGCFTHPESHTLFFHCCCVWSSGLCFSRVWIRCLEVVVLLLGWWELG